MARTSSRAATARRSTNTGRSTRGYYVEGNTVRRLQELPNREYYPPAPVKRQRPAKERQEVAVRRERSVSAATQKNREKAKSMNRGFVVFLAAVSVAILFCCINYIQLKSQITASMKNVAALESDLSQLKEDNDAYYSQVTSNVDLSEIKKIAIGRLGMKYPTEEQTMTYTTVASSYVRQYQDVPDSK